MFNEMFSYTVTMTRLKRAQAALKKVVPTFEKVNFNLCFPPIALHLEILQCNVESECCGKQGQFFSPLKPGITDTLHSSTAFFLVEPG